MTDQTQTVDSDTGSGFSGGSPYQIKDLEKLYLEADDADKDLFSEQRSNLLLIAGEHYNRNRMNLFKRLRDARAISQEQKIRLTKNHVAKICDSYVNHVVSAAPGVGFEPAQASELRDQKTAELNKSVWEYAKEKEDLEEQIRSWVEDYVGVGEVMTKLFFDPAEGEVVFEEFYGFNFLIDPGATSFKKARHAIIRKMVDVKKLRAMFPGEEHQSFINESADSTYTIFDRGRGQYQKSKGQCLVREFYFRPNAQLPNGYWYYTVKDHILTEGELPAGKFPIVFRPFRRLQTKARGQGLVKMLRPYQTEINRSASKIAEHQITLGDDKLLIQNGTKVTAGASLPGVRSVNFTGMEPKVLAGRDGSQYLNYMNSQISEMYNAAMVDEKPSELTGQVDPYSLLFRSASQKKAFQIYIKRFEGFLREVATLYLELARYHFPDDKVIRMVGRKEQVNIAEFKNSDPLCYRIKVVPQADDIETKMGKQLVLNHVLQYVGAQMSKEDIGKLIKAMPYSNEDESFNDLTMDYESATNDILALDRGETPPIGQYDNHQYMVKRLTARMRMADFRFLPPQIQQNYAQRLDAHEQVLADEAQKIQMAESGFIPTSGYLVVCDLYVQSDPNDPEKTKRVRVPSDSLNWLIQKLQTQGASLDQLEQLNQRNLVEIAQHMGGPGGHAGSLPNQGAGNAMPGMMNGPAHGSIPGNDQSFFGGGPNPVARGGVPAAVRG